MAALWLANWHVHPGEDEAFAALAQEFLPLGEKHGATSQRFFQTLGNPTAAGTNITYAGEFETMSALGSFLDNAFTDPDTADWLARATGPNAPAELTGTGMAQELLFS